MGALMGSAPPEDRVTGPPSFVPVPERPDTYALLRLRWGFGPEALRDATDVLRASALGAQVLEGIALGDVWLGDLAEDDPSYGFYLSADRVVRTRTRDFWQALRTLAHEGRHAVQDGLGLSTILEFHEPGTLLPWDARGYLLLNRALEADADAWSVAASHQLAEAGRPEAWKTLEAHPEFGGLAEAYAKARPDGMIAAMGAAYDAWYDLGRDHGYDTYLLGWLERLREKSEDAGHEGPVGAAKALDDAALQRLGWLPEGRSYLADRTLDEGRYAAMAPDVEARLAELVAP
ncbi:MAG: DUF6782 family putative metallopeptidase [Myxococcota bacterium]